MNTKYLLYFFIVCFYFCKISFGFSVNKIANDKTSSISVRGFYENKGQIIDQNQKPNASVRYLLTGNKVNVQLKKNSLAYDFYTTEKGEVLHFGSRNPVTGSQDQQLYNSKFHRVDIEFAGANENPEIIASEAFSHTINYFNINNASENGGILGVKQYNKITYKNLYNKIDLEVIANTAGKDLFKYNFIIRPGGNIQDIRMVYKGAKVNLIKKKLVITTSLGEYSENIPISYTLEGEKQSVVNVDFVKLKTNEFGFTTKNKVATNATLVIDPNLIGLTWASYDGYGGGGAYQLSYEGDVDASGNYYVSFYTSNTNNIATIGAYQSSLASAIDGGVSKFDANGQLIWGTYYGGEADDVAFGTAVTSNGVYITGNTRSTTGIATVGAETPSGFVFSGDISFLARFDLSSGVLLAATYIGGEVNSYIHVGLEKDASGNLYLAGVTQSTTNISTPGVYQTTLGGGYDYVVMKVDGLSLYKIWSTYYGGNMDPGVYSGDLYDLSISSTGAVVVVGGGKSGMINASPGAYQSVALGGTGIFPYDGAIFQVNASGTNIDWATYFGTTGNDYLSGIDHDAADNIYVTGRTDGNGLATIGQTSIAGDYDGLVAKFNSVGNLQWAQYYGGPAFDYFVHSTVSSNGTDFYTSGRTQSNGLATSCAYQTSNGFGTDNGWILRYDTNGGISECTYFGTASPSVRGNDLMDLKEYGSDLYLCGFAYSTDLATAGVYQTSLPTGDGSSLVTKWSKCAVPWIAPDPITGATTSCGGLAQTYSTNVMSCATGYVWTVPADWTINSGQGTSSINVTVGNTSGNVTVAATNACGTGVSRSLAVSITPASTDPVSISVSANPVCAGGSFTATVNGGSLGPGANWKWYGAGCGAIFAGTGSPKVLTVPPAGSDYTSDLYVRAEGGCNTTNCANTSITVYAYSAPAASISISSNPICAGGSTTLSVVGGNLGGGSSWKWYTSSCGGTAVGTGASISVSPSSTETYYVRAEGPCNTTVCVSNTVTVNTVSSAPTSISVSASPICPGGSTTLTVNGGSLGTGANWQWYSGSCGGTAVGSGASISVSPGSTTNYFVRAEGTCNNTACATATVTVNTNSTDPTSISVSTNPICPGGSTTLSVNGGGLGTGANWQWYSGSCGGTAVGSGASISVSPGSATNYFVRAEGTCNTTACATATVTVNTNSTDPTSISISTNPICPGGSTTLTINGGSLGTGANWQWYSGSCGGTPVGSGASISVSPGSTTNYFVRAEGTCNNTACATATVTVNTNSTDPTSISISTNPICPGGSTTLTVNGGSLGTGANWQWYSGSCGGTAVGSGASISVSPGSTTNYFVRAEGTCNNTACATATVTVNTNSTDPTSMSVSTNPICPGGSTTLTVNGGSLGTGANWQWYSGSCGGTAVGSGTSISVSPGSTTNYFVRAEGTCNTTACVTTTVTVNTNSTDPTSISVSTNPICPGGSTTLSVNGGSLGTGANWQWYSGSCGGTAVGAGASISVSPGSTTNYFVRAEGTCNNTACATATVTVNTNSTDPTSISISTNPICPGGSTTLTVNGGSLGTGANWQWYSGSCGGTAVGSGASISVSPGSTTNYFVRAEGTCNTTACATATVTVNTNSTAPTSITASPATVCSGGNSTLTINGGSLGTGANWQWYSGSCGGTAEGSGNSIVISPTSTQNYFVRAEGTCNTTACAQVTVTFATSVSATWTSPGTVCDNNGPLNLSAFVTGTAGGAWAGIGVSGSNFDPAGLAGQTISITYSVGSGACSDAISHTITVNNSPVAAWTAPASLCSGQGSINLTTLLNGGTTGGGTWYGSGVSGTNFDPSALGGTSPAISYAVTLGNGCRDSVSHNILINNSSTNPTSISATLPTICNGGSTTLSVNGGNLGTGANWQWYSASCGGTAVGSGSSITVSPSSATDYYVRAEGTCNTTSCAQITINVNVPSTNPTSVSATSTTICAGDLTTLSVNGGSLGTGADWHWYSSSCGGTPVGTGSSLGVGTFSGDPASITDYYVRAEGACNTTSCVNTTITVNSNSADPTGINASTNTVCPGGSSVLTVTGGSLGSGANWQWYSGACGTGTLEGSGSSITVTPGSTTTYYVRAEGTCNNTICQNVTITYANSVSAAWTPPMPLCSNVGVIDLNTYITGTTGGTWSGTNVSAGHLFNPTGLSGSIAIQYNVGSGTCSDVLQQNITVNSAPVGAWTAPTLCTGQTAITLDTWLNGGSLSGGTWYVNGVSTSSFDPDTYGAGPITISYVTPVANSCQDSIGQNLTIQTGVSAAWTNPVTLCDNITPINLNTLVTGTLGGTWSYNSTTDSIFDPSGLSGIVNVTYTVLGSCNSDVLFHPITIRTSPQGDWTVPANTCTNTGVLYLDSLLDAGSLTGGTWYVNGSAVDTINLPALAGGISLTVSYVSPTVNACQDSIVHTITTQPGVFATWTNPGTICSGGGSVSLAPFVTGTTGGTFSGTGVTAGSFDPSVIPNNTYTSILYTVSNGTCTDTLTHWIFVSNVTNASFTPPANLCSNKPITLSSLATGSTTPGGNWYVNDTLSLTGIANPALYPVGNSLTIKYVVGTGACKDSSQATIAIQQGVIPTWTAPAPLCSNADSINLNSLLASTATQGGTWSYNSVTDTIFYPSTVAGTTTVVVYTVTNALGGCTDTDTHGITVKNAPSGAWTLPTITCSNAGILSLDSLLNIGSLHGGTWYVNGSVDADSSIDLSTQAGNSLAISYVTPTILGCSDSVANTLNVSISSNASWNPFTSDTLCSGTNVSIDLNTTLTSTATTGGVWSVNGTPLATSSLSLAPYYNTSLQIKYAVGTGGCRDSVTHTIYVYNAISNNWAAPTVSNPICTNSGTVDLNTLLVAGSTLNGTWTANGVVLPNGLLNVANYGAGNVIINYSVGTGVCRADSSKTITIQVADTIKDSNAQIIDATCHLSNGSILNITASGNNTIYTWYNAANQLMGNTANLQNIPGGSYYLTLKNALGCITSNITTPYVVKDTLGVKASFVADTYTGKIPQDVNFTNNSIGAVSYSWDFGNNMPLSTATNPKTTYVREDTYTVILTAFDSFGCSDTAMATIKITEDLDYDLPTVFTPNDDGVNDVFFVGGTGIKSVFYRIYNRWGQIVFEQTGGGWDGRGTTGLLCSQGAYYYLVEVTDKKTNTTKQFLGTVQLIR